MASETKHTPGPWFAHKPVNTKRMDFGVTAGKPYDPSRGALRRIAWVGNSTHSNPDLQGEVWANARLIAAAPDMLAALIVIAEWAQNTGATAEGEDDRVAHDTVVAAIAKAAL